MMGWDGTWNGRVVYGSLLRDWVFSVWLFYSAVFNFIHIVLCMRVCNAMHKVGEHMIEVVITTTFSLLMSPLLFPRPFILYIPLLPLLPPFLVFHIKTKTPSSFYFPPFPNTLQPVILISSVISLSNQKPPLSCLSPYPTPPSTSLLFSSPLLF